MYELKNNTNTRIPVELATTLAVEGQQGTVDINYTDCLSGGSSCWTRIQKGYLTLNAHETAKLYGVAELTSLPTKQDFYIKTSLRYNYNGQSLIPFFIGMANTPCTAAHSVSLEEIDTLPNEDLLTYSVRLTNDGNTDKTILPGTLYLKGSAIEDYVGAAVIASQDEEITGKSGIVFVKGESFVLPPNRTADIDLSFSSDQTLSEIDYESFKWDHSSTAEELPVRELTSKSITGMSNRKSDLELFSLQGKLSPVTLPATGFPTHKPTALSIQPDALAYRSLNGLRLEIPVIEASAEIVQVPLNEDGEWAIEWLGERAGILEDSPLPGQGTAIIAGHNHLDSMNNGPFIGLSLLQTQDRIIVNNAAGQMKIYSVYANELISPTDGEQIYRNAVPGALVLVTCENELPEGGYANRRVVYAEPLQ